MVSLGRAQAPWQPRGSERGMRQNQNVVPVHSATHDERPVLHRVRVVMLVYDLPLHSISALVQVCTLVLHRVQVAYLVGIGHYTVVETWS